MGIYRRRRLFFDHPVKRIRQALFRVGLCEIVVDMQSKSLHRKVRAGGQEDDVGGVFAFALDFPRDVRAQNAGHTDIQKRNIRSAASVHFIQHIKRIGKAADGKKQIRMLSGIILKELLHRFQLAFLIVANHAKHRFATFASMKKDACRP